MKKMKVLLVSLLTCFCCFAFSSCELIWLGSYATTALVGWVFSEDKNAPTKEELRLPVEINKGAEIVEITQNEDGFYVAKTTGGIKNLGDKDADEFTFRLAYYDINGYLLDTFQLSDMYVGAGDTYKVEYEAELYFEPATARIYDVELYAAYDYASERESKAKVEFLDAGALTCVLGEDGLYHATVTGQVKVLEEGYQHVYVQVAFYDTNGYLYVRDWYKKVTGLADRTYTVECISDTEIVSYKIVYGSTNIRYH